MPDWAPVTGPGKRLLRKKIKQVDIYSPALKGRAIEFFYPRMNFTNEDQLRDYYDLMLILANYFL